MPLSFYIYYNILYIYTVFAKRTATLYTVFEKEWQLIYSFWKNDNLCTEGWEPKRSKCFYLYTLRPFLLSLLIQSLKKNNNSVQWLCKRVTTLYTDYEKEWQLCRYWTTTLCCRYHALLCNPYLKLHIPAIPCL